MFKKAQPSTRILLILTGGTICSFESDIGEQSPDTEHAQALIVKGFRQGSSPYRQEDRVSFEIKRPLNILSENLTVDHWNTLLSEMRGYDFSSFDGVIILHGTDTLAYTASLLSLVLAGLPIPVILVSSQLPLYHKDTNGHTNFRTAVELIVNGIRPNVYAVYQNDDQKKQTYLHFGAHLLQCANHSQSFYSCDMMPISKKNAKAKGAAAPVREPLLYKDFSLAPCVLRIQPYPGLDYRHFDLQHIRAILHSTYHSETVAVAGRSNSYHSILYLLGLCLSSPTPIPLFVEPCDSQKAYRYETTGEVLRSGIDGIFKMTSEMAYVKLLLGCALSLTDDDLRDFVHTEINGEFLG